MENPDALSIKYDKAFNWLKEYQMIHDGEWAGGFWHSYNLNTQKCPFIHSEMAGYAASLLTNLYKEDGSKEIFELAVSVGDFLARVQAADGNKQTDGAFPFGIYPESDNLIEKRYYSFDVAMCASGLVDLYFASGKKQYLSASLAAADWLIRTMQNPDGSFRACWDATQGEFLQLRTFAGDRGCLHAKNAIALLKVAQLTGERRQVPILQSARKVCDWVLSLQDKDGAFWANELKNLVFTHAHCYAVEGLLYAGHRLGESKYLEAAVKAAQWLRRVQNSDGSFYRHYKVKKLGREKLDLLFPVKTTDATAQAARIFIAVALLEKEDEFWEAAKRGINFLDRMQCHSPDSNADGGFYYQLRNFLGLRRLRPSLMTWCTQFALSAVSMFHRKEQYTDSSAAVEEIF